MAITTNVFKLNATYDLIKAGCWVTYNPLPDAAPLFAMGSNGYGQLGINSSISTGISSPTQIPGSWISIGNNGPRGNAGAIRDDRVLFRWGVNCGGTIGDNSCNQVKSSPIQIPGTTWSCTINGGFHTMALKCDNTLWVWGLQNSAYNCGVLGLNNGNNYNSPVQVPGTTWCAISATNKSSHAIKTDGTFWSWGWGQFGLPGNGTSTYYSSPVQVPGSTWSAVSATYSHVFAKKTDGTLWAWGDNREGMLGDITTTERNSPVQIPGTTWADFCAGYYWSGAIKTDGTLWTWGCNSTGGLGLGGAPSNWCWRSSPTQVPGTTWSRLSLLGNAYFTKTDGTLWNTGLHYGYSTGCTFSSPIQLTGTCWVDIKNAGGAVIGRRNV